ncbi:AAA family ATPase [Deferribacter abyssi]|uniref:AAA family ATPase n=1 Tax=Deferribacter abyssi TaxID=213806 RepID=UPI003C1CCE47
MKFKRLILNGFKSFVDKTVIDFPEGITCVVGPNGSGKSNILDAIRWVFGEQSPKELRGNNMEDVIFAGSENRKPAGFCEVTLVISDVSEEITEKWGTLSEISISRKFYRTGEREYLINGRKCRLKDIKELFYDTGIGARSISIIEQGRVEKIIQASPEELRLFFDEVAGVTKFKERKKEALNRLSHTRENLLRLADILSEVEKNKNILEIQVKKLERYREIKQRLDFLEKEYLSNNFIKVKSNYTKLLNDLNDIKVSLSTKKNELRILESELKVNKSLLAEKRESYSKVTETIIELNNSASKVDNDIAILKNNIEGASKRKEGLKREIQEGEERLKELSYKKNDILKQVDDIEKSRKQLSFQIKEKEEVIEEFKLKIETLKDELDEFDSQFLDLNDAITEKRNQIIKLEAEIDSAKRQIKGKDTEFSGLLEELNKNKERINFLEKQLYDIKEDKNIFEEKLGLIQNELFVVEEDINQLSDKIKEKTILKKSLEKELKILTSQLDKYTFGQDKVSSHLKKIQKGYITDFIKLMDDDVKLEFGDIVVFADEDKDNVFELIEKMQNGIRFTFISMLEEIEKNIIGLNSQKISESLICVNKIYRKMGRDDKSIMIKEIRDRIFQVENEIKQVSTAVYTMGKDLEEKQRKLETLKLEQEKFTKIINEKSLVYERKSAELLNVKKYIEKAEKSIEVVEKEKEILQNSIDAAEKEILELKSDIEAKAERLRDIENHKDDIEGELEFYEEKIDLEKNELTDLLVEKRGLDESYNSLNRELRHFEKELNTTLNQIKTKQERLKKLLTVDITNWEESLKEKMEKKLLLEKEKHNILIQKNILEAEINDLDQNVNVSETLIAKKRGEIETIEREVYDIEIKLAGLQSKLSNIRDQFYNSFEANIEAEFKKFINDNFSLKKNRDEYNQLKEEVENLGPLNMAAEDEYKSLVERYEFLSKQKEDLEKSIESIQNLINEIDETTVNRFKTTFEQVRQNFQDVFKILFGDGKAELKLTQPENILETGVEIFVQPPGKKLTNMNLLSGGEKAMTACTLLFAMFLYKPTPFCFLDEVDAPLDETNIGRFLKIVRKLSKDTQFVIITHNQKTMSDADSLYGITMEEPGVSKVLSVKMENI